MQFSSIEQIELTLRVKKQSESGFFSNERLLVIKSGFISYHSKIPKQFVGNTRSLELIGELPKYTLSAEFVTKVTYNCPVLELTFLKQKLIDRDGFEKMISSSIKHTDFNSHNNSNGETSTWNFKCKEVDLVKAFVQQVKICMKPQPQTQRKQQNSSSLPNRKSLQPSFKFVFDAFKQAKQERQQKEIEQIINERASNYFSSSQIKNQLKNRQSALNFGFLKGRQTVAKQQQKSFGIIQLGQTVVDKPIVMPLPYQQVQQKQQIIIKRQKEGKIVLIQNLKIQNASIAEKDKQIRQTDLIEQNSKKEIDNTESQAQMNNEIVQLEKKSEESLKKEQKKLQLNQDDQEYQNEEQNQNHEGSGHQLKDSDEQEDMKSVGKISSIYQNEDAQLNHPQFIVRTQSKTSLISLVKVIQSIYQVTTEINQPQTSQKSQNRAQIIKEDIHEPYEKIKRPQDSSNSSVIEDKFKLNQPHIKGNQLQDSSLKRVYQEGNKIYLENSLHSFLKTNQLLQTPNYQVSSEEKIKNNQRKQKKFELQNKTFNQNNPKIKSFENQNKSQPKQQKSQQNNKKNHLGHLQTKILPNKQLKNIQQSKVYSFGVKNEPQLTQQIRTDFAIIKQKIQQHFKNNIDCRKDQSIRQSKHKQKGKSTKNQNSFKKFQTIKQITIHFNHPQNESLLIRINSISKPIIKVSEQDFDKKSSLNQCLSSENQKDQSIYFQLIEKYKKLKQKQKKYSFIMHTDFINYPSLLDQRQTNDFKSDQNDRVTKCIFSNYSSRLYSKFKLYQFFQSRLELFSVKEYPQYSNTKIKLKIPIVFYMRYKQFQGLIFQKCTYDQGPNEQQINQKQKVNKQKLWKKHSQQLHKNHCLTQPAKITQRNILKQFLQHFDIYLVESIQKENQSLYLLIEEKSIKQAQKMQNYLKKPSGIQNLGSNRRLNASYMFLSMNFLIKIKKICVQQLINGLRTRSANPLNFQQAQKHVTINLIQQVLLKIISNKQIQNLISLQQIVQNKIFIIADIKIVQFVQNTIMYVLTQLFGFAIDSSKEIKHFVKTESVLDQNHVSQNQKLSHTYKQQQSLFDLVQNNELFNDIEERRKHKTLQVLEMFDRFTGENNQVDKILMFLQKFRVEKYNQKAEIVNKIIEKLFKKTADIFREVLLVLQIVTYIQKQLQQTSNQHKDGSEKILNFVKRNIILVQFYNRSQNSLQIFFKTLIKNNDIFSVISLQKQFIQKCINHTNSFVIFLQQNLNYIPQLKPIHQTGTLRISLSKVIDCIIRASENIFYLKNMQIQNPVSRDLRQTKKDTYQKIKTALLQINFLQKTMHNLPQYLGQPFNLKIKTFFDNRSVRQKKFHLEILLLELKSSLNPQSLSQQDLFEINQLLMISLNSKEEDYILKCLQILQILWKLDLVTDEKLIDQFAYSTSILNLVQSYVSIKSTIAQFLTEQVTIQQRLFYLKKYPQFQHIINLKQNISFL